ncbi:MAG: glycosyltransferase [Bacteroidetes bacterium]|nr:glycosyltransferase [Bacteroidota bacterium]
MNYILIPVFNESQNIPNLYEELKTVVSGKDYLIVFSDDGSSDNTGEVIKSTFASLPFYIVGDGINRGPGAAFNAGFEYILSQSKSSDDVVITLEADCTSDITLLPKMIAINKLGFNLILASVYAQGGGFSKTTFMRKLISSLANLMFRFLFDIKILTLSSFYRLYSVDLLRRIKEKNGQIITEAGFICMLEILVKAIFQEAKIIEIPMMLHSDKRKGKSKMKIMKTSWQYLKFFAKWKMFKKAKAN